MPELDLVLEHMVTGSKWGVFTGFIVAFGGWSLGLALNFIEECFK